MRHVNLPENGQALSPIELAKSHALHALAAIQNFQSDIDCDGLTTSDPPITDQTRRPTPTQWPTPDLPTGAASREFLRPKKGPVATCALEPRIPGPTISREEDGIENMEANTGMLRYNTVSNKVRVIRTPGGEHRYLHIKKRGTSPKCGDCGVKLPGVRRPQHQKTKA